MTVASVVAAAVTHVDNVAGILRVYSDPPDSVNDFPCALVYARDGRMGERVGKGVCDHRDTVIIIEVYHARQVLPQAVNASKVWPDLLMAELLPSSTLNIQYPITWRMGPLRYNDDTYFGVHFEVTVRE